MANWRVRLHRKQRRQQLLAYHAGELSAARQREMEAHLAACAECRATLERFAAADRALPMARPEPPFLPPAAADAIFRSALQASRAAPPRQGERLPIALSLAAAAGIGLLFWAFHSPRKPAASTGQRDFAATTAGKHSENKSAKSPDDPIQFRLPAVTTKTPDNLAAARRGRSRRRTTVALRVHTERSHLLPAERNAAGRLLHALALSAGRAAARNRSAASLWHTSAVLAALNTPQPANGRLVLIVTGQPAPRLNVEVSTGVQQELGFARVSAFAPDTAGNGIWRQCMIRNDAENESMNTAQYQVVAGQPVSQLIVEINQPSERSLPSEKGTKP